MSAPTPEWNDPKSTWKLASYQPPTERRVKEDRRTDGRRATLGERRVACSRALKTLLRL